MLRWFNSKLRIIIKINALDRALGVYLKQYYNRQLYLVTFYLRKLLPAELNYNIYNKELLAVINTFKQWRVYYKELIYSI